MKCEIEKQRISVSKDSSMISIFCCFYLEVITQMLGSALHADLHSAASRIHTTS